MYIRGWLQADTPSGVVPLGTFGNFLISPALVLQLTNIFETSAKWKHSLLYVPSIIPFVVICAIAFFVFKLTRKQVKDIFYETSTRCLEPILSLGAACALVELLQVGGERSCTNVIGQSLAALGPSWRMLGLTLGFLGAFFAGSATGTCMML